MEADPAMPDSRRPSDFESEERRAWFQQAVLPLEPRLRAYVRHLRRNGMDVEDLVHDSLIRALTTQTWREVTNPWAFLRSIARNLMIDSLRRQKVVTFELLGEFEAGAHADETPGPEANVLARDELRRLSQAITELPPQQRKVFTMRKLQDLSISAIAEKLGLSVSTVEKHLVRALRICAEKLQDDEGGQDR